MKASAACPTPRPLFSRSSVRVSKYFNNLRGKKVLITAGPTREHWDPVRFLSNASSGQMGVALALEASRLGADVALVLGPPPGVTPRRRKNLLVIPVTTALQREQKVQGEPGLCGCGSGGRLRPGDRRSSKNKR